jgi:NAD(P)-dependent dehydrogenase (short-subunit alcohol dehydrogenase family)
MTRQQRSLLIGAAAVGAAALAQRWRAHRAFDFDDKVAVVTGGSRGLGLVLARELAGRGARLVLVARTADDLAAAVDDIRRSHPGTDVISVAADVRRREDAERAIAEAARHFGRIDVVVNNAGTIQVGPIEHMKLSDYEDAMDTHFWGPLYMIRAALPHMPRQDGGRIVNISSIGGRIAVPHLLPYSASKFALVGLSDGLRAELARHNIVVTTVCPGLMRTGSPMNALFKGQRPQEYAWFAISDSLPLASVSAERAARQIVDACGRGDAELIVGTQASLAVTARTLLPELTADMMSFMARLLPGPAPDGDEARTGRESESAWAPSALTTLSDRAAGRNNER